MEPSARPSVSPAGAGEGRCGELPGSVGGANKEVAGGFCVSDDDEKCPDRGEAARERKAEPPDDYDALVAIAEAGGGDSSRPTFVEYDEAEFFNAPPPPPTPNPERGYDRVAIETPPPRQAPTPVNITDAVKDRDVLGIEIQSQAAERAPGGGADAALPRSHMATSVPGIGADQARVSGILRCGACQLPRHNTLWLNTFGILVCNSCKYGNPLYDVITKTKAKDEYLVTDTDLQSLGFLSKPNPRKPMWAPMRLFLRSQVEELSKNRFPTLGDIERARRDRQVAKLERQMARAKREREGKLGPAAEYARRHQKRRATGKRGGAVGKRGRKKSKTDSKPSIQRHTHVFPKDKAKHVFDEAKGVYKVYCEVCGFQDTYEEF